MTDEEKAVHRALATDGGEAYTALGIAAANGCARTRVNQLSAKYGWRVIGEMPTGRRPAAVFHPADVDPAMREWRERRDQRAKGAGPTPGKVAVMEALKAGISVVMRRQGGPLRWSIDGRRPVTCAVKALLKAGTVAVDGDRIVLVDQ